LKILDRLRRLISTGAPKICVIRGQGIGDVIMLTPTIRALKKEFPDGQIIVATDTRYLGGALVDILMFNPDINGFVDKNHLVRDQFDAVLDLHCPCTEYEVHGNPPINRIDLFANAAGVKLEDSVPHIYLTKGELEEGRDVVRQYHFYPKIAVQPFASNKIRSFDHRKLKEILVMLGQRIKAKPIIFTHQSDWQSNVMWDNLPGGLLLKDKKVREIAAITAACDLVLCPDSSLLHIAGALGIPTVSYFGPTHPAARINHYNKAVAVWKGDQYNPCPCVVKESLVLTASGYREIQDLEVGQTVKTTDSNWNKITKVHKNLRKGRKLYDIEYFGSNEPITVTQDHKMLAVKGSSSAFRRKNFTANREWIPAEELTDNDFLCVPRNKADPILPEVDLLTYQVLGLYAAEGHLRPDRKSVVFTVGSHEEQIIETLRGFGRSKYSATVGVYPSTKDNSTRVEIYSQPLVEYIDTFFGKRRAVQKEIPFLLWNASDIAIESFITGYLQGDGYQDKDNKVLSTASRLMAYGTQELLTRFGIWSRIYKRKHHTNYKQDAIIYRVYIPNQQATWSRHIVDEDYLYVPIKKIELSDRRDEYVYDITVENSTTFCIQNMGTWDCWYKGCSIGELCWKIIQPSEVVNSCIDHLERTGNQRLRIEEV